MNVAYAFVSVVIVSFISVLFAIPFLLKKKISRNVLLSLLSVSIGVLLSTVFMDFLPEIVATGYTLGAALYLLSGFLVMFILEKLIHFYHSHEEKEYGHGHAYHLAPLNLIGDGMHNFIDGLVIAGSYAISLTLGIAATVSIIFHEIPQEIADLGVLIYSGMSRKKAIMFNFLSAFAAIIGAVTGILLAGKLDGFTTVMIPFAAGNFIYIAASSLVPQLHRQCKLKDTMLHLCAIVVGICIITLVTLYGPAH